jgi:hypothetical protein
MATYVRFKGSSMLQQDLIQPLLSNAPIDHYLALEILPKFDSNAYLLISPIPARSYSWKREVASATWAEL